MRFRTLLLLAMPLCGAVEPAAAQSRGHHLICVTNGGGFVLQANFEIGSPSGWVVHETAYNITINTTQCSRYEYATSARVRLVVNTGVSMREACTFELVPTRPATVTITGTTFFSACSIR